MIVADTNLIVYLLLPGKRTAEAEEVFVRDPVWAAPTLWRSEFRNVLASYMRAGDLELNDALAVVEDAERLMEGNEYTVPSGRVLRAADESGRSAYDCEFAVLARDLGVPLVTWDRRMRECFPKLAVSPAECR